MTGLNPDPGDTRQAMSEEYERARALADVIRDQEERAEAARDADVRRQHRDRVRHGVLAIVWAVVAYVWLGSPAWLKIPPVPQPTVADQVRGLRLDVFLQSQKIAAYREDRGRLPWVLSEAGPPFPGMEYRRKDSRSYELQGASGPIHVRYDSDASPLEFVGQAAGALEKSPVKGR